MRFRRFAMLIAAWLVAGCDDDPGEVIVEYAGGLTVYGELLRSDGSRVLGRIVGSAWGASSCPPQYPQPVDTFVVTDGIYRVAVSGGIGVQITCVELRFHPDPSLQLDSAVARVSVPFRLIRSPPDSVRLDVALSPIAPEAQAAGSPAAVRPHDVGDPDRDGTASE